MQFGDLKYNSIIISLLEFICKFIIISVLIVFTVLHARESQRRKSCALLVSHLFRFALTFSSSICHTAVQAPHFTDRP
jgi:hypothetical protein